MISHDLALISKESGIFPGVKVYGLDNTKAEISLQLLITTGTSRDKDQAMNLIWGAYKKKYALLLDKLRNNFLKINNNYPRMVSEAYILLLWYRNDTTTCNGTIKYMDAHHFDMYGAVEERKNKTPHDGQKGGGLRVGKSNCSMG